MEYSSLVVEHMPQIDYTMTKENYHCILQRHSVNSDLNLCGEKKKVILQHYNDPKHVKDLQKLPEESIAECTGLSSYSRLTPSSNPEQQVTLQEIGLWNIPKS